MDYEMIPEAAIVFLSMDEIWSKKCKNNRLMKAIKEENVSQVIFLINEKYNVNHVDNNMMTPLLMSVSKQNLEISKILIDSGADVDAQNSLDETPLMISCLHGNYHITNLLLDFNADVNMKDCFGNNALMLALWQPKTIRDIITRLYSKSCDNTNDFNVSAKDIIKRLYY